VHAGLRGFNMGLKIVLDFIESINSANIDKLYNLMSNDHVFIDSRGKSMVGNENMKKDSSFGNIYKKLRSALR